MTRLRPIAAAIGLVVLAFATRYYLLAPETGDIDEATFMVMAQSVLRGALPYELAFDNKPAGFFYLLAGVIGVFGQNIEAVRLFGSAMVAAAALVLWVLCRRYLSLAMTTGLVALFVVAQAGMIGDSTKSELVANLCVAGSLLALVALPGRNRGSFLAGLLIGCAVLTRTNLAYLALAVTLLHLVALGRPEAVGLRRSGILALAIGGLLPLGLLVLPYASRGELQLLWIGAVEVAWSQAHGSRDLLDRLILLPHSFVRILPSLAGLLVVICGIGIWRTRAVLRRRPELQRDVRLGWLYLVAIEFSIIMSGTFYNHYMLQVLPPLVLLGAIGFAGEDWSWRRWVPRVLAVGVTGGLVWFGASGAMTAWQQFRGELDRPLREVTDVIWADLQPEDRIWATANTQLAYVYLNRDPILPVAAFPANLTRELIVGPLARAGLMPEDGAHAALERQPRYVLTTSAEPPRQLSDADKARFSTGYELWRSGKRVFVYRRIEGEPAVIAPTLRTARLTLRRMVEADYPAYRVMMMSERAKYVGGPHDETTAWLCFCHDVACWTLFGHGALMIEVTATGETVGQVGVNGGPLFPEKELGWLLYEGFEGHGYVSEAAAAMRAWAFGALGVETLVSYIDPANARSQAVAERLGAVRDDEAFAQDPGDLIYRHYRP